MVLAVLGFIVVLAVAMVAVRSDRPRVRDTGIALGLLLSVALWLLGLALAVDRLTS